MTQNNKNNLFLANNSPKLLVKEFKVSYELKV